MTVWTNEFLPSAHVRISVCLAPCQRYFLTFMHHQTNEISAWFNMAMMFY